MSVFIQRTREALEKADRSWYLRRFLQQHEPKVHAFKLEKLEGRIDEIQDRSTTPTPEVKSITEFTQTQQLLAIKYLAQEATLGATNIETDRLIELGHLLAAKPIPLNKETGAWNTRNSGLRSAFIKASNKTETNQIADLRFVLRFFRPLSNHGSEVMDRAASALEKDIARLERQIEKSKGKEREG
jgi:hypothetical protein